MCKKEGVSRRRTPDRWCSGLSSPQFRKVHMSRNVDSNDAPVQQASIYKLREIVGDLIEAVDQLDMARETGGVVSHEVMSRLRRMLAKPSDGSPKGGR